MGYQAGLEEGTEQGKPLGKLEILQNSEYMNAKVSGTAIAVNDVNTVEHNVGVKLRSKNVLTYPFCNGDKTTGSITYTDNGDGSVTVNGTATGTAIYYLSVNKEGLENILEDGKTYILSGEKSGIVSLLMQYKEIATGNNLYIYVKSPFTVDKSRYIYGEIRYQFRIGATADNLVLYPQLEEGTTVTPYTPYVEELGGIEVSRYGKNLFDVNLDPHSIHYAVSLVSLNDGELTIKQNATAQYASYNIAIPNAKKLVGKTITISCDCKVGEGGNNTTVRMLWLNSNGGGAIAGTDILYKPYISPTEYQHISVSGVVNAQPDESHDTLVLMFYGNVTGTLSDGEYYSYFKNIQIELGTTATDYEPYTEPTTYQSTADGTVEGVKSISPNMTLLSNNNGVVINANYLRDIDTYIDNLITNVALTGGE